MWRRQRCGYGSGAACVTPRNTQMIGFLRISKCDWQACYMPMTGELPGGGCGCSRICRYGSGAAGAAESLTSHSQIWKRNIDSRNSCFVPLQANFLEVDVAAPEYADVEAVLLDPSCSGSGTVHSRMDFLLPSQWQGGGAAANEVSRTDVWHAADCHEALCWVRTCCISSDLRRRPAPSIHAAPKCIMKFCSIVVAAPSICLRSATL